MRLAALRVQILTTANMLTWQEVVVVYPLLALLAALLLVGLWRQGSAAARMLAPMAQAAGQWLAVNVKAAVAGVMEAGSG
jgi:hypothetical protein